MSAGNIEAAADALTGAFQASDARELSEIISSLPELCQALHTGLAALDGEVTERAGPSAEKTGLAIATMAQHASMLLSTAEEAVENWAEESRWWMTGED